ncbi:MAG: hypothetical protein ACPGVC_08900 [Salibacteraceae bacterium]
MNSLITVFVFCLAIGFQSSVKAEYNGHFIEYELQFKNGKTVVAHSYLSDKSYLEKDIPYKTYLESRPELLLGDEYGNEDYETYAYHEYRLTYKYQVPEFDSAIIFKLAGKKAIHLEEVSKVRILEMIDFGYASLIVNDLGKNDEKWFNGPVVRYWGIGDELNHFHVFIHKENKKLTQILNDIDVETKTFEQRVEQLENELNEIDWEERASKEEELEQLLEQRSQQVSDALSRLFAFKLVIIGYLSC